MNKRDELPRLSCRKAYICGCKGLAELCIEVQKTVVLLRKGQWLRLEYY